MSSTIELSNKALEEACALNKSRSLRLLQHLEGLGASDKQLKLAKYELRKIRRSYRKKLKSCSVHFLKGNVVGTQKQLKLLLNSRSARIIGQLRMKQVLPSSLPTDIAAYLEKLGTLDLTHVHNEDVIVELKPKGNGKHRTISKSGRRRAAQQHVIRDFAAVTIGDNEFDGTKFKNRGVNGTMEDLKLAVDDDYNYWCVLDIKNYFPSLRPGHFSSFPLSSYMLRQFVFLPKTAQLKLAISKGEFLYKKELMDGKAGETVSVYLNGSTSPSKGELASMLKQVRQGMLQGDVLAPQFARTFLGREIQQVLENRDICYGSHQDDVIIGARSQSELESALKALSSRLENNPVGPLSIHKTKISHVKDGFSFLGYKISQSHGELRISPSYRSFQKFRLRLQELLSESDVFDKDDLRARLRKYAESWFISQGSWTFSEFEQGKDRFKTSAWGHVRFNVEQVLNEFIFYEFMKEDFGWCEEDVDFSYIPNLDLDAS